MIDTPQLRGWTEKDFLEELGRFRKLCGDKTFWAKTEEQRDACVSGLTFMYLNLVQDDGKLPTKEQIDKWGMWFSDALDNYNRRKTIIEMMPLKRALGLVHA